MSRAALVFFGLAGCMPPQVQSALVETGDLGATYVVTTVEGAPTVTAEFRWVSGMADVLLDDGDRVTVDGTILQTENDTSATYRGGAQPAPEHVFVLQRGDAEPITDQVVTATPFALTSGAFAGTYDLEATLTWAPTLPNATVRIVARGTSAECPTVTLDERHPDTGSFAFTGADVKPTGAMPPPCSFTLEITRSEVSRDTSSPLSSVSLISDHFESTTLTLH